MLTPRRVPLAWSNLTHNKVKLAGSLAGVTFAVALMFMEMGFMNALLDGMVALVRRLDADLVLVSRSSYSLGFKDPFSRRHLYEALEIDGVRSVRPIYIESTFATWLDPGTGRRRPIRVVAFRPEDGVFRGDPIGAQVGSLAAPRAVLFDGAGKGWIYGAPRVGTISELAGHPVRVVGEFNLGADFLHDGNVLMSDRNFLNDFADRRDLDPELRSVDLGLIQVEEGTAGRVKEELGRVLPRSVAVFSKQEFIDAEQRFWLENTPVGFVFNLGMYLGFIVGTVICYQILFSGIASYLREYATLLAMGYRRADLVRVVLQEAVYMAVLGFAIGMLVAFGIYRGLESWTRMPFTLDAWRVAGVFGATLGMCILSACLAVRKLWGAAPADLF